MKLGTKLATYMIVLVAATGLLNLITISAVVERSMTERAEKQEVGFTEVVADNVSNAYFSGDSLSVQQSMSDLLGSNRDIAYIYIVNDDGSVGPHTFEGGFPVELIDANVLEADSASSEVLLSVDAFGIVRDVGARILDGLAPEIHIGFSQVEIASDIGALRNLMAALIVVWALLGSVAAVILSGFSTKYLRYLAGVSLGFGKGRLNQSIEIRGNDEIAELAKSLGRMREDLAEGLAQLRESEESNRTLLGAISSTGEGVVVFDPFDDGRERIRYANAQYLEMMGLGPDSQSAVFAREGGDRLPHEALFERIEEGCFPVHSELEFGRSDGTRLCVEASFCTVKYEGSTMVMCVCRDVTERQVAAQLLVDRNRDLAALNDLSKLATNSVPDGFLLARMMEKILDVCSGQAIWMFVCGKDGADLDVGQRIGIDEESARGVTSFVLSAHGGDLPSQAELTSLAGSAYRDSRPGKGGGSLQGEIAALIPLLRGSSRFKGVIILSEKDSCVANGNLPLLNSIGGLVGSVNETVGLWSELSEKEAVRRRLLEKVITAQEEERKRISRELHDETSQSVAALSLGLDTAATMLRTNRADPLAALEELKRHASAILKELHRIEYDLRPSVLDDLGLLPAVRWYLEMRLSDTRMEAHIDVEGSPVGLPADTETTLFRIIQESIFNAVKYSDAEDISVSFRFGAQTLEIAIEDNGAGFDIEETMSGDRRRESLGLLGMKERAELIGGLLEIGSQKGEGTSVVLRIPISEGGEK